MPVPIPSPKKLPYIGNLREIDTEQPLQSLIQLANIHGPIYRLSVASRSVIIISSYALLNELCDETRFQKAISANFRQIRNAVHDGLFTAYPEESNWGQAHRVLMPTFGPLGISKMFDEMHDIAIQMVLKWARHGEDHQIDVTEDFTRLTLDSIALCAMGARINSFYSNDVHPFVNAMVSFLVEAGNRGRRPPVVNDIKRSSKKGFYNDIGYMRDFAEKLYTERLNKPNDKNDLLNAMINGRDKETGQGMSKESIINNMITFLVAGHETTSGLLSFLFYQLIHNPETYQKAQAEIDAVIGSGSINVGHMTKLPYLTACLRETLRLTPTAPAITLKPVSGKGPQLLGGRYEIEEDQNVMALLFAVHRDTSIYGEDALEFKPERMLDEKFNTLPRNAWKPFGNGVRACIGRAFAWQESLVISALLLQKFNLRFHDPQYQLQIKETLTLKPKNLVLRARLRSGVDLLGLERDLLSKDGSSSSHEANGQKPQFRASQRSQTNISILYGSNTGTCEALATSLGSACSEHGFLATTIALNAAIDNIAPNSLVVVITASYEGAPADNAALFYTWLETLSPGKLSGLRFAVFGCGHHDWVSTYQKVPKQLDAMFEGKGATRICSRGEADAGADSIFNVFDEWLDDKFWPAASKDATAPQTVVENEIRSFQTPSETTHVQAIREEPHFRVIENRVLTAKGQPEKHHVAFEMPEGISYTAGDYLTVFAENDSSVVSRVCKRFHSDLDDTPHMNGLTEAFVKAEKERPSVWETLHKHVELNQPATKKQLMTIAKSIPVETERESLQELLQHPDKLLKHRISTLDLLELATSATLSIESFVAMLPPLRARQYSISSSPLHDPTTCTISLGVVHDAGEYAGSKPFVGLASNYLAHLKPGDTVRATVRPSRHAFHLPLDIEDTPIIMIAAGSGLAPFRGFVQERAALIEADRKVAPALLFFGCRSPTKDFLYAEELEEWTRMGAVDVRPAFSREPQHSHGCKYVQDRLWQDREDVKRIYREGGKIFMCASNAVNEGVRQTASNIVMEQCQEKEMRVSVEEVEKWLKAMRQERVASDVFG